MKNISPDFRLCLEYCIGMKYEIHQLHKSEVHRVYILLIIQP